MFDIKSDHYELSRDLCSLNSFGTLTLATFELIY